MPPLNMTGQQLMPGTTENMLHAATGHTVTVAAHYSTVNIDVGILFPQPIKNKLLSYMLQMFGYKIYCK